MLNLAKNRDVPYEPITKDSIVFLKDIPVGIFITDSEGKICYLNHFLNRVLKSDVIQEYLGVNIFDNEMIRALGLDFEFRKTFESHKGFSKEKIPYRASDGSSLFLSLKVNPLKDKEEKICGIICLVEDQTEKVNLECDLKERVNQLSIINEVSNVLSTTLRTEKIIKIILTGVTAGEGLGFNRAFLLLKDEKGDELQGKMAVGPSSLEEANHIWKILSEKNQSLKEILSYCSDAEDEQKEKNKGVNRIVKDLRIPLDAKDNVVVEVINGRKSLNLNDDSGKSLDPGLVEILGTKDLAVAPLICEEKVFGVILADNFITKERIKDEDVKFLQVLANQASRAIENSRLYGRLAFQVEKLEGANKSLEENTKKMLKIERFSTIGQVTSQVAHQLRNPLTIIGGFANSILKKTDGENPNYKYLKIISEESERAEKILDQIQNYSPSLLVNPKKQNLNKTVENALRKLEDQICLEKIEVEKDFQKDLPDLDLDSEQFERALLNVFKNAILAMPQGGKLTVRTFSESHWVKLKIADSGVGISPEVLLRIFDPFFTTRAKSNGLGLTLSQEIIKRHNGEIEAKSQKDKGSVFTIQLPLRKEEKNA
ncbi:MAG: hypothetical protein AMJ90_03410 [candidate division Zixibacteria bacterium SM23_73_2]|nr:MAG: hypothetical protein AMJ90_03410 [candidate division Zixibacteria bacterium SM23_73_2]